MRPPVPGLRGRTPTRPHSFRGASSTLAALVVALVHAAPASAFPLFRARFFTAFPEAVGTELDTLPSNADHCGVCHDNFNGGGARNPFGLAVEATDRSVASIAALGPVDSDGDGFTNEEEILGVEFFVAPTFPGLTVDNVGLTLNVALGDIEDILTPTPERTHDEDVDGDLSDDRLAPTPFVLRTGDNVFRATQQGDAPGRDIDYLTVTVPAGTEWTGLFVDDYVAAAGNLAFLGLQSGPVFTVDAGSAQASDLLGGAVFGAGDLGIDILPDVGGLPGALGFSPPLPEGQYSIWLNQTGAPSTVELTLLVPEPQRAALLVAGIGVLAALVSGRQRRPRRR